MNEEQFEALLMMIRTIASEEAGRATHQQRPRDNARGAINYARNMFDLPEITEEDWDV